MKETISIADAFVVGYDAHLEGRPEAEPLLAPVFAAVRDHSAKAGVADAYDRAMSEGEYADETYINSVGPARICEAVGLPEQAWELIRNTWCEVFMKARRAAPQPYCLCDGDHSCSGEWSGSYEDDLDEIVAHQESRRPRNQRRPGKS